MAKIQCFVYLSKEEFLNYIIDQSPGLTKDQINDLHHGYTVKELSLYDIRVVSSSREEIKINATSITQKIQAKKQINSSIDFLGIKDQGEEVQVEFFGVG